MAAIRIDEADVGVERGRDTGWGWFLGAGIAWIVVGLSLFSFNPTTISLISYLVAAILIVAGLMEFGVAAVSDRWRWVHVVIGGAFVVFGVAALFEPMQTFSGLAVLFGWYLVLKGTLLLCLALASREPGSLWGLGLALGVVNISIGIWALGYPGRSAWLLVVWIGLGALMHGIANIVQAFELRTA